MTEWLKLMLEEIARRRAEQESGRAEEALRERELAQTRPAKTPKQKRGK